MSDSNAYNKQSTGEYGFNVLSGTQTSPEGHIYGSIYALETSVLSCKSGAKKGDQTVTNLTIPAGGSLYGFLSDIVMTSGNIVGYLKN